MTEGANKQRICGKYFRTPAIKHCVVRDMPQGSEGSCVMGAPAAFIKLMWICTPLPTPAGSVMGEKVIGCSVAHVYVVLHVRIIRQDGIVFGCV